MRNKIFLVALFFVLFACNSVCKAELAFDWADAQHPPGPFYREGYIPFIMKSYGNTWIDGRTGLPMHFTISCAPTIYNRGDTSKALIKLDVNLIFNNGRWQTSYSPKCWYDVKTYHIVNPDENIPTSCPSNPTIGNPVSISSGRKIQNEIDFSSSTGFLEFYRTYHYNESKTSGEWTHNFNKKLYVVNFPNIEGSKNRSTAFLTKSNACTQGWNELKTRITDSWTNNSIAVYDQHDTCNIVKNGIVVKKLPIVDNSLNSEFYTKGIVQLKSEDGSLTHFYLNDGKWISTTGDKGRLERFGNSGAQGWKYTSVNNSVEIYSAYGNLVKRIRPDGAYLTFTYDIMDAQLPLLADGKLLNVKDNLNNTITFSYTNDRINSVTVDGNKTTSYTYNGQGLISKVIRPDNSERIYHYEDTRFPTFLTGITDERGKRYATWAYDAQGRAISSEHAGGVDKTQLNFNADGSTTVTNPLGKQTVYRFDDIAGARRVVKVEGQPTANCAGANQNYTYTAEGWVESKTDWKGIKTTYQYNSLGQEISRTEAFGTTEARTITTEWHPALYAKTKITEPGKQTTFSYDTNGRLLNQSTQAISN